MGVNKKRSSQQGAQLTKGKHSIKRYFIDKRWDTSYRTYSFNQEEIIHRIENNLPIDDLYANLDKKYNTNKPKKTIPTHKVCKICGLEKPIDSYYKVNGYYQSRCKKCQNVKTTRDGKEIV